MENTILEDDILILIKRLDKSIRYDYDKRLEEYDLTSQQVRILSFVNWQNNKNLIVHQQDLEKIFKLSKSTISGLVNRLVKKGLLNKHSNKKYVELSLTSKAKCIISDLKNHRGETVDKLLNTFSKEQRQLMIENIKKLIRNMEEEN